MRPSQIKALKLALLSEGVAGTSSMTSYDVVTQAWGKDLISEEKYLQFVNANPTPEPKAEPVTEPKAEPAPKKEPKPMTELSKLLSITPATLAQEQLEALKSDAVNTLKRVITAIEANDYETLAGMIEFSPSGDCMGCDNHYIDFHCGDIDETITAIKELHAIANKR